MFSSRGESKYLFHSVSGSDARRAQVGRAPAEVNRLKEADILASSDDEIMRRILSELSVTVPTLARDQISFARTTETKNITDHWGDTHTKDVPVFTFDVPFSGDSEIFRMQPSTYNMNPPRAEVRGTKLLIVVSDEENAEKLKASVDATLDDIEQHLRWHRELWSGVEDEIARSALARLTQRREEIARLGSAESGLANLGFKPKAT